MADSHVLITLFHDLKRKIDFFTSKNVTMDVQTTLYMNDIVTACNTMDVYIESYKPKEEYVINMGITYEQAYFNLTAIPRGHVGPTAAMRRYAHEQEKKQFERVEQVIQMGKELDANKDKPYF
uniref:Uncharacterized protein n=1 Tax=viral metagenome TaxID=1070528 RepID=A0A6C0AN70_9ZZZZ